MTALAPGPEPTQRWRKVSSQQTRCMGPPRTSCCIRSKATPQRTQVACLLTGSSLIGARLLHLGLSPIVPAFDCCKSPYGPTCYDGRRWRYLASVVELSDALTTYANELGNLYLGDQCFHGVSMCLVYRRQVWTCGSLFCCMLMLILMLIDTPESEPLGGAVKGAQLL